MIQLQMIDKTKSIAQNDKNIFPQNKMSRLVWLALFFK